MDAAAIKAVGEVGERNDAGVGMPCVYSTALIIYSSSPIPAVSETSTAQPFNEA